MTDTCKVTLDCIIDTDPVEIMECGIERIYEVNAKFQSTRTKQGIVYVEYSNLVGEVQKDMKCRVNGVLRSKRVLENGMKVLKMYVYAQSIEIVDRFEGDMVNCVDFTNLEIRDTPKARQGADSKDLNVVAYKLKASRHFDRFSVIPCCSWNSVAKAVLKMKPSMKISGSGNLQSHYSKSSGVLFVELCVSSISDVIDNAVSS